MKRRERGKDLEDEEKIKRLKREVKEGKKMEERERLKR